MKDITKFYNILNITDTDIITDKGILNIYKITPCKIINNNDEFQNNVFSSYLSCVKLLNFDYQILINTENIELTELLLFLDDLIYKTDNNKQRELITQYKKYLDDMSNKIDIFDSKFYLVTNKLDAIKEREMIEGFKNIENVGISISKINSKEVLKKLLYQSINGGIKVEHK